VTGRRVRPAVTGRGPKRHRDDEGGLWIRVGIALGVLFYGFMLVLWAAGFTAILPFVVIPLVLVALIGSNALLGGPRRRRQLEPRPIGPTDRGDDPSAYRPGVPAADPAPGAANGRERPPARGGSDGGTGGGTGGGSGGGEPGSGG
jgi:hypothetical protein